jgi:plastocyanin
MNDGPASQPAPRRRGRPRIGTILTILVPLGALVVLVYLLLGADGQARGSATAQDMARAAAVVTISGYRFTPDMVAIRPGQTVAWINKDGPTHTVTSDDNAWDSVVLLPGQRFALTLGKPGVYRYSCLVHPSMRGTIIVSTRGVPTPGTVTGAPTASNGKGGPYGDYPADTATPITTSGY